LLDVAQKPAMGSAASHSPPWWKINQHKNNAPLMASVHLCRDTGDKFKAFTQNIATAAGFILTKHRVYFTFLQGP
jgi:hypothetical protein